LLLDRIQKGPNYGKKVKICESFILAENLNAAKEVSVTKLRHEKRMTKPRRPNSNLNGKKRSIDLFYMTIFGFSRKKVQLG
jgi:hypothetical protein